MTSTGGHSSLGLVGDSCSDDRGFESGVEEWYGSICTVQDSL